MGDGLTDLIRAAAYARDSGGHDQELSIDQQVERISEFCQQNGYALTRLFRDAARSGGKTTGRDQFLAMVRYLTDGAAEKVLVFWSYSRFARDWDDSMYYLAYLRQSGVKIVSIADPVPDTLDGRIMESLAAWQHAKFRETLAKDVKRGMRFTISAHKGTIGKTPPGYRQVPVQVGVRRDGSPHMINQLEADHELVPLIQLAFKLRAEGYTYGEIHERVRLFKYPVYYSRLFRNEIYLGVKVWDDGRFDGYAPAIIDLETWSRVQAINRGNDDKRDLVLHPKRAHSSYLLSGLLRCARCGNVLVGSTAKDRHGGRVGYYMCTGRNQLDNPCGMRFIRDIKLDWIVLDRLKVLFEDPSRMQQLYERAVVEAERAQTSRAAEAEQLKKTLTDLEKRIGRLVSAIESAGHSQAMIDQLGKLEEERDRIQFTIAEQASTAPAVQIPRIDDLAAFGAETWRAIEQADKRKKQLLLRGLIEVVTIDRVEKELVGEIKLRGIEGFGEVNTVLQI